MTTYTVSAVGSCQKESASLQKERSGETARGRTAITPCIPRSCSARRRCREHSPLRICQHLTGTSWDRFRYAAAQDRIVRSPRTCRSEKTCDRSYPRSDELAGLPKLDRKSTRLNSSHGSISYA